jgi:hypothetical protein
VGFDGCRFARSRRTGTDHLSDDGGTAHGTFATRLLCAIERYRASGHVYRGGTSASRSGTWRIFAGLRFGAGRTPGSSGDLERSRHRGRAGSFEYGGTPASTRRETRLKGFYPTELPDIELRRRRRLGATSSAFLSMLTHRARLFAALRSCARRARLVLGWLGEAGTRNRVLFRKGRA